ncbi:hypothetical protein OG884_22635 [Streptosporangium sp. NBC_01755]|uniref:hypothetical protein n=1 Tax=unclassified Streptosporangium TaxID=2632669 RepID=UPI002DDACA5A|nr:MULTISPECIES: hypothetical protein [unclassified Streptosporangium]WSA24239.1 hypothetical protein OIE13_25285 [Streptosporangium sp. NBC_01810]WSC97686.1 hypothetical protein OG884_22635 [Streptosporangium sp. NBC_01755]
MASPRPRRSPPRRRPPWSTPRTWPPYWPEVHHIHADVHELSSGNAIVSVHYGLLAYTDGESFWWTGPELNHAGSPLLSSEPTLLAAARQLAEHHAILRTKDAADVVRNGLPLPADVILAEHVDPR